MASAGAGHPEWTGRAPALALRAGRPHRSVVPDANDAHEEARRLLAARMLLRAAAPGSPPARCVRLPRRLPAAGSEAAPNGTGAIPSGPRRGPG